MTNSGGWNREVAVALIERESATEGAALPILHALQEAFGFVPRETVPMIATALNVTRAEIHGVVTFYHDFRHAPPGRHVVKLCRAEACQSKGGALLEAQLLQRLGIDWRETTADGSITLEPVYCLGLCATAPACLIDGEPVGRLDAERLDAALAELAP